MTERARLSYNANAVECECEYARYIDSLANAKRIGIGSDSCCSPPDVDSARCAADANADAGADAYHRYRYRNDTATAEGAHRHRHSRCCCIAISP